MITYDILTVLEWCFFKFWNENVQVLEKFASTSEQDALILFRIFHLLFDFASCIQTFLMECE